MKTKNPFGILMLFLFTFTVIGCDKEENSEEGKKVTDYQEYELTVASKQLLGFAYFDGKKLFRKVYAVKKDGSQNWESFSAIQNFTYEKGYEYRIRISDTSYLDYDSNALAWTEHKLLEVLSKEKRDSENLPENLLLDNYVCLNAKLRYVIEADNKDEVEKKLMNSNYPTFICKQFVFNREFTEFAMLNENNEFLVLADGLLKRETINKEDFPESYQLIPMEGRVTATERWTFLIDLITHRTGITMDAFTVTLPGSSGNSGDSTSQVWLYQDITEQVKASFPNAGVKTMVFAQIIELLF
mgnify:FL=1